MKKRVAAFDAAADGAANLLLTLLIYDLGMHH